MPSGALSALLMTSFREAGRPVEVQVRTEFQHSWAELSEGLSDRFGAGLKYGQGNDKLREGLVALSERLVSIEELELFTETGVTYHGASESEEAGDSRSHLAAQLTRLRREMRQTLQALAPLMR